MNKRSDKFVQPAEGITIIKKKDYEAAKAAEDEKKPKPKE